MSHIADSTCMWLSNLVEMMKGLFQTEDLVDANGAEFEFEIEPKYGKL